MVSLGEFPRISGAKSETLLNFSMKRCVATEIDMTALLRNKAWNKLFVVNISRALTLCIPYLGCRLLLPLDVSAHILYSYFTAKFPR